MTKSMAFFVFKYSEIYIPKEIQCMVVKYLRTTMTEVRLENKEIFISMIAMSKSDITFEYIDKYIDWDWFWLTCNPYLTLDIIKKYIDRPWDWGYLSDLKIVTPEFVSTYPNKSWNWRWLSNSPEIIPVVNDHPDWNWDWKQLSKNKNAEFICSDKLIRKRISLGSIKNDMDKPCYLPYSPNLTIEFINDNLDLCWEIIMKSGKYKLASAFAKK